MLCIFFSFRERIHQRARALSWAGRDLLPALFFGFPPSSSSSSLRGECGAAELPALGGLGGTERTALALALALAQAQSVWLVSSAGSVYVSTELSWPGTQNQHCVLGDSLAPNSPGNAGESGFQGHFQFYSSGKTFGVCLMVCSNPWLLVETASRWQRAGGPHSGLPSLAAMTPQTRSSPRG